MRNFCDIIASVFLIIVTIGSIATLFYGIINIGDPDTDYKRIFGILVVCALVTIIAIGNPIDE